MKYCQKCILPETYPGISFNKQGICNFCLEYHPYHKNLGKDKLREVLTSKKKAGQFDCVVPLSGGKDSSFILFYVVKELGLKPLAVSYNSGFQKKIAEENVQNACEKLGVKLVVIKSPGNIQRRRLRTSYLLSKREGSNWGTCVNCEAIIRTVSMNTARKYDIPYVMWGSSALESMDVNKYVAYNTGKSQQKNKRNLIMRVFRSIQASLKDPIRVGLIIQSIILSIIQRIALHFPIKYALKPHSVPPLSADNPKFILFFDYIQWDSMRNIKILENELDWKHPGGIDSRFDCSLHCVVNFNKLKDCGVSQDGINFCNFIREGRLSREEALARESNVVSSIDGEYKELLERVL